MVADDWARSDEESLAAFKRAIVDLMEVSGNDPAEMVAVAGSVLSLIHLYAADALSWAEFREQAGNLLARICE